MSKCASQDNTATVGCAPLSHNADVCVHACEPVHAIAVDSLSLCPVGCCFP